MSRVVTLPAKNYSRPVLFESLKSLAYYDTHIEKVQFKPLVRGSNEVQILLTVIDSTTQTQEDELVAIGTNHDINAKTARQISVEARIDMNIDAGFTKDVWTELKGLNDALELHAVNDTLSRDNAYTEYRSAHALLGVQASALAERYMMGHAHPDLTQFADPGSPTQLYKWAFVDAAWKFWMYVAARNIK